MPSRPYRWLLLVLSAALLPAAAGAQERDSAGIHIVTSPGPRFTGTAAWRLSERPALDLGGDGDVIGTSAALELVGGRLVIYDGENRLRFYDRKGKVAARFGRKGEGPGEFRLITLLRGGGDSVVVYDGSNARLTRVSAAGKLIGMTPLRLQAGSTPGLIDGKFMEPFGLFSDASIAVKSWAMISRGPPGQRYRDSLFVLRIPAGGSVGTSMLRTGGREMIQHAYNSMNGRWVLFGKHVEVAMGDDAIFVARNDRWEIEEYGRDGKLRRMLRTAIPPRPVTSAFIAARKPAPLPEVWAKWDADRRALYLRESRDITYASHFAPIERLFTAPDGTLYALEGGDPEAPGSLAVFDRTGILLTRMTIPLGLRVIAAGRDRLYAAQVDSEGENHLLAFDILR